MNVIEIKNLTFTYPGAEQPTLKNISLEIEKGDFLAIVGNNGCGKSTLCKALNGLIPHFITGIMEGDIMAAGILTREADVGTLARKVGYVYQDFENQVVRPTVLDDASYACMNYAMPDYLERGKKALKDCGLEGKEDAYIWQLSGGQTHLLALAGALSLEPEVLILDEPIAQLDPLHADRIYQVLRHLNEKRGITILVIEHHTEYIADYCKHVVLMNDGEIRWKLPTVEALGRVEELEASNIFPPQVTRAAYRLEKKTMIPTGQPLPVTIEEAVDYFNPQIPDAFQGAVEYEEDVEKRNAAAVGERETPEEPIVSFEQVAVSYRSVKGEPYTVFSGLNLDLYKGEKIAVIGSNGAGKSTMMKLMVGLLKPSEGQLLFHGRSMQGIRPEALGGRISLVYQNPEDMFIKDSIKGDIAYAMQVRGIDAAEEKTRQLLQRFRLTELDDRDGRLLSGGQMRRASLAIGIALEPEILMLDEPTANLDIATRKEIIQMLKEIKTVTDTVLIATHDMQLVTEWAERILVLHHGGVIGDGSRSQIFCDTSLTERAGIRPPEIFQLGRRLGEGFSCYTVEEFVERWSSALAGETGGQRVRGA